MPRDGALKSQNAPKGTLLLWIPDWLSEQLVYRCLNYVRNTGDDKKRGNDEEQAVEERREQVTVIKVSMKAKRLKREEGSESSGYDNEEMCKTLPYRFPRAFFFFFFFFKPIPDGDYPTHLPSRIPLVHENHIERRQYNNPED